MYVQTYAKHNQPRTTQDRNMMKTEKTRKAEYNTQDISTWTIAPWSRQNRWAKTSRSKDPIVRGRPRRPQESMRNDKWRPDIMQKMKWQRARCGQKFPPLAARGSEVHSERHTRKNETHRLQREQHSTAHLTHKNNDAARLRTLFMYGRGR